MSHFNERAVLARATIRLVKAYLSRAALDRSQLPELIVGIQRRLLTLGRDELPLPARLKPAVSVKRSIGPDHIVCLESGRRFKTLTRHLKSSYGMTPDQYRAKWGLAADYPMEAPSYAAMRASLAKEAGLGRRRRSTAP